MPPVYDSADDFKQGAAYVKSGERWYYISKDGNKTEEPPFEEIRESGAEEPLKVIVSDGKSGYASQAGEIVIPPVYFDAGPFCEGLAKVKKGRTGKWGYIDESGKTVIKPRFDNAGDFTSGLARVLLPL